MKIDKMKLEKERSRAQREGEGEGGIMYGFFKEFKTKLSSLLVLWDFK